MVACNLAKVTEPVRLRLAAPLKRPWCNGSTWGLQPHGEGSNLSGRSTLKPTCLNGKGLDCNPSFDGSIPSVGSIVEEM